MARYEDKVIHDVDGIEEYGNPAPGWLMWMFYGAIIFSVIYLGWFALAFDDDSFVMEYREATQAAKAEVQAYFAANPIVPPSTEELLAGSVDPAVIEVGKTRFTKTCAPCHGDVGQGLIGPNLIDDYWLHGGKVTEIFTTIVKGVPAKGMPPWGRALSQEELKAVTCYVRSLHEQPPPAKAKAPEGDKVQMEPLPKP